MKKRIPDLIALLLAILVGFGNVYNVVINFLKTPPGTQYLGTGNFHLPDYFYYLVFVEEGLRGYWQVLNLYTQEGTVVYWVIHWPYLLIGHLSRLFSLSAPAGYWISVFLLSTAIVFCAYIFLKLVFKAIGKSYLVFPVLIVYILASPFSLIGQNPFRIEIMRVTWYYQADFFSRISTIPHHLLSGLGVMIFLIASFYFFELLKLKEKRYVFRSFLSWLVIAFLLLLVMSTTPIPPTFILPAFGVTLIYSFFFYRFFKPKGILFYGISFLGLALILFLFGLYFQQNIAAIYNDEVGIAETGDMQWPSLKLFFLSSGLVFVLAIPSLLIVFRNAIKTLIHPSIIMGILASVLSYALFFTRLSILFKAHNSRFLFPDAYLFMATVIFLALDKLKTKSWKRKVVIWLVTILIICFSLPSIYTVLKIRSHDRISFLEEYNDYLPNEIIDGFKFLEDQPFKNPLVLMTTVSGLRMILPIYTQARVYASNLLHTIDFPRKSKNCNDFFTNAMSNQQKINFLRQEKINYLIFTVFDLGNMDKKYLHDPYFISEDLPVELIFSNSKIVIYKVL